MKKKLIVIGFCVYILFGIVNLSETAGNREIEKGKDTTTKEKTDNSNKVKNRLEKKFNIEIEGKIPVNNNSPKVLLTKTREIEKAGEKKRIKKLLFLNSEEQINKTIEIEEMDPKILKNGDEYSDDIVTYNYENIKLSKNNKLIARITTQNEAKRKLLEGSDKNTIRVYNNEGNILLEKSGIKHKFPIKEVLFSNNSKKYALYFYSPQSGLEWIEFYDLNGNKINEYKPPRNWEGLNPVVSNDNYLFIESVIIHSDVQEIKTVNMKINFNGEVQK